MEKVGFSEARSQFARLLDKVAEGSSFTIVRRGRPVALLIPVADTAHLSVAEAIAGLRQFRTGRTLGDITLHELIAAGRRGTQTTTPDW
jgi:prevent-host-death family protein